MISAAGWIGLFIMLLGIILTIIGIVYYEIHLTSNKNISWWVWTLLVIGIVLTIIGTVLSLMFQKHPPSYDTEENVVIPIEQL